MTWTKPIPDVGSWQPKLTKAKILRNSLMVTCQVAQARIVAGANTEKKFRVQNYDQSRRLHFPIEGVYAVAEIKQTLGRKQLDEAMEKLVKVSRLQRPANPYGHITENQHITNLDKEGAILNPLHTTVFATQIPTRSIFADAVKRFGEINAMLDRNDMVNMLCVLDHGTAWYSVETGSPYNATYMYDRDKRLALQVNSREPENSFYRYYVEILGHLTRSVLGLHDISSVYGEPPPDRDILFYPAAIFNIQE